MSLNQLWQRLIGRSGTGPRTRPQAARRHGVRLTMEQLEDRHLPSSYTAASVSDLIADINAANLAGGSNTIALVAGTTFTLTAVNNNNPYTEGPNGLPIIAANDNLSIVGNGDTIERSTAKGTPRFRLLDVAAGASLTLANLTLQGGLAYGGEVPSEGGAILNGGSLTLNGVTVQNNMAIPNGYGAVAGGGIYSSGSLTLQDCTIQNNQAFGENNTNGFRSAAAGGGLYVSGGTASLTNVTLSNNTAQAGSQSGRSGCGGGLYVGGGTASLTNLTVYSNTARGGDGGGGGNFEGYHVPRGDGGNGLGGGIYVAGGTVSLHNTAVDKNSAIGGNGAINGLAEGAGLFIDPLASVCLDAFTVANVINNQPDNIYGSYTIC